MIIALTGKMGSGKTTALNIMKNLMDFRYVKFAAPLYQLQEEIYKFLDLPYEPGQLKDRRLLQVLGTDWGRNYDTNIWVNAWEREVNKAYDAGWNVVTDDCRFLNEAQKVKQLGGFIIKIEGPQRGNFLSGQSHASEAEINDIIPNFTIYNTGNESELEEKIKEVLECIQSIANAV